MKLVYAPLLALCALASVRAAEEQAQPPVATPVELYKGPKGIDLQAPRYPQSERQSGREGWVIVNMMIDPQGKPYEATVVESTAVNEGDRARADSRLALLKPHNLYEDAYAGLASYQYHHEWGNAAQQLSAVRRALAGEKDARALRSWGALGDSLDADRRAQLQKSIDQIQALRTNDQRYVFFRFDPKLQYTIAGRDRGCSMEVVGDPGTKFRLIQL